MPSHAQRWTHNPRAAAAAAAAPRGARAQSRPRGAQRTAQRGLQRDKATLPPGSSLRYTKPPAGKQNTLQSDTFAAPFPQKVTFPAHRGLSGKQKATDFTQAQQSRWPLREGKLLQETRTWRPVNHICVLYQQTTEDSLSLQYNK